MVLLVIRLHLVEALASIPVYHNNHNFWMSSNTLSTVYRE
jgi:hypothetical protein